MNGSVGGQDGSNFQTESVSTFGCLSLPGEAQGTSLQRLFVPERSPLTRVVNAYLDNPRPLFSRLPVSYRAIPLGVRARLLGILARLRARPAIEFPLWPIERSVDEAIMRAWREAAEQDEVVLNPPRYDGRTAALLITHDLDSAREIGFVEPLREIERRAGLPSAFGFVPELSWPTEDFARSLVAEGCEVYWHDIGHNGRLPYLGKPAIRAAFDRVSEESPWAPSLMRAFRSGQLLMSRDLFEVVAERFEVDLSLPDTERDGPYGAAAGCGTVFPFSFRNLLEIPLSMPQDVYLRQVYGLSPEDALRTWINKLAYIKSIGGVAVLNVHPIWANPTEPAMLRAFERFVGEAVGDPELLVTTPVVLARLIAALAG